MKRSDDLTSNDTAPGTPTLRFLIVDDQPVVSYALRHLLSSQPGWHVIDHVRALDDARDAIPRLRPDIVVVDLLYPDSDAYDFLYWIVSEQPRMRCVVFSIQPASIYARRCIQAGAAGYIGKDTAIEVLLDTMRRVAQGQTVVCGSAYDSGLTEFVRSAAAGGVERLSRREIEVLNLMGQGLSNRDIARHICRSDKTVESHRYRIARKLKVNNGPELVEYARRCLMAGTFEIKNNLGAAAPRDASP